MVLIEGSGSNYLSNEIFYRLSFLRERLQSNVKTGHLHVPKIQLSGMPFDITDTQNLVSNVTNIIKDAITGI